MGYYIWTIHDKFRKGLMKLNRQIDILMLYFNYTSGIAFSLEKKLSWYASYAISKINRRYGVDSTVWIPYMEGSC